MQKVVTISSTHSTLLNSSKTVSYMTDYPELDELFKAGYSLKQVLSEESRDATNSTILTLLLEKDESTSSPE